MANPSYAELLNDKDVRQEIDRYKWIESEKAGQDIGFEKASKEWLNRYGAGWLKNRSKKRIF